MRDHRQGNDLAVVWSILRDGKPFILSGKKWKLYLKNMYERKEVEGFTVKGNQIHWTFFGKDQKTTGRYSLILVGNENEEGMITVDTCDFVNLVSCSCKVQNSEDSPNVETETIELTSNLDYVAGTGGGGEGGGSYDDTAIWEALNDKVDKEEGKGLSTNDYTDEEREKLASLENYDDAKLKEELSETYQPKGDYVETKNLATINGKPLNEGGNIEIESGSGGASIEVDSSLSTTSTNPVQNKVITAELNKKAETGAIPTKLSQLTDNVGFAKQADVEAGYQPKGDYVTDDELSSKGYATEKYVDDALEGKQDTIEDLESIRSGAGKGATAVQPSTLANYATTQQFTELSAEVGEKQDALVSGQTIKTINGESILGSGDITIQGGGEPSQYIKDATTSEDGNTLTLTKKDNTKVVFSPSGGGGTGGGVSKEHYYDITILDQIYRVKDACANSRYVVVGTLKGISLYDRLTNTQIISDWTTNIAAVKLTSEGVYIMRSNLLEVRDFNLNIIHTVDLGHSNFDKFTFTDNECYAVIDGALTRINATSEPQIVAGYESNVVFVKHAYNVGTSIVMLDSSDNKYYLSILEYPAYKSPVPNQSLVYVGTTNGTFLVKTSINTLGIVANQLILGRLHNEAFSDIKVALIPLNQLLIIESCSVIEGIIFSVATAKNFISDKVAIMNNTIYNISNPSLTSHTLCAVLGQVGNGLVTRIKVIDL